MSRSLPSRKAGDNLRTGTEVDRLKATEDVTRRLLDRLAEIVIDGPFSVTVRYEAIHTDDEVAELCPVIVVNGRKELA